MTFTHVFRSRASSRIPCAARIGAALYLTLCASAPASAQSIDSLTVAALRWRSIGPALSSGRLSDVVGIPGPSKTFFIAAAAGGVWKSMNNGVTWRPLFDDMRVVSMGVLAIAPSDTQVVWAGTGEPNLRYPTEPGGGVYKSTDGGNTWKLMGLEKTERIGRIVVNPKNPNIVYVAALGALYGPNPERGLYKTTDGGQTWALVKFISDRAGFIDVAMDPRDPDVLYAASWQVRRTPYMLESGGPGSGLWKTTDGGKTWTEIVGNGFPTGVKGRIGLAVAPSKPDVIYALTEAARPRADKSYVPEYHAPESGLYRSSDAGHSWTKMSDYDDRPFYYSQVRVDPHDSDRIYYSSSPLQLSVDGGKTARVVAQGVHSDTHGVWIDPNDSERWAIADDGGFSITFDKGGTFFSPMNLPLTQFYHVGLDNSIPYTVCGGGQDNGVHCGPSRRQSGATSNAFWSLVQGGDMAYALPDLSEPQTWYTESNSAAVSRSNLSTGDRVALRRPNWEARYQWWEDSIAVVRGDPLKPATKIAAAAIAALRAKQHQDSLDLDIRWGWDAGLLVSAHGHGVVYFGGSRVLRSTNRGENMAPISPDLTKKLLSKIDTSKNLTGGVMLETTQTEAFGYVVALSESPVKAGILYAGTDDGNVWKTHDDGVTWEDLSGRFPGLPNPEAYVSSIEPSHFDTLSFYVVFDNHRSRDGRPYLYATIDGGKSFRLITNGLPSDGPADYLHVIREDPHNRNLLFAGSSIAVYASMDRGANWSRFMTGMPSAPVFDLKIQSRDRELVAATHGRSFWIVDIAPLEDLSARAVASRAYLFQPKTALQWSDAPPRGNAEGNSTFGTNSPPYGAAITYRLGAGMAESAVQLVIANALGDTITTLRGPGSTGAYTVVWNFQIPARVSSPAALTASMRRDSVLRAARAPFVLDSLRKAGYDTVAITRASELIESAPLGRAGAAGGRAGRGGGGRGGRGGGGLTACDRPLTQWDPFCARPAEGATQGPRGNQGPFTSPLVVNGADPKKVLRIFDIIGFSYFNTPGGRAFLGSGNDGGSGPSSAPPGDYIVTLVAGSETMKRQLHVERAAGASGTIAGPAGTP
jgi:photosystem II stability/assembly factor-like uncharacterized protein